MPNVALTNFYVEQIKQLSLKLTSKKEIEDFRKSMIMEIGSQFSGACATSIADCADEIVRIGKSDFHSVEELFNTKTPIFVGELLFFVENCYFLWRIVLLSSLIYCLILNLLKQYYSRIIVFLMLLPS